MLSTGGRDGSILLWDLRCHEEGPVVKVVKAHEEMPVKGKRARPSKPGAMARSVTDLVYSPYASYTLYSSGTFDG